MSADGLKINKAVEKADFKIWMQNLWRYEQRRKGALIFFSMVYNSQIICFSLTIGYKYNSIFLTLSLLLRGISSSAQLLSG